MASDNLDYGKLKCDRCGNTTRFVEVALRPTRQPFTVHPNDGIEWDVYELISCEENHVEEIVCADCEDTGEHGYDECIVWRKRSGS